MGCSHSQHTAGGGNGLKLLNHSSCNYCNYCDETLAKDASEDNTVDSSSEHEANVAVAENESGVSDAVDSCGIIVKPSKRSVSADAIICCRPTTEDSPNPAACCQKGVGDYSASGERFFASLSSVMSQNFDMDEPHPPSPPFLGSSYSILREEILSTEKSFPKIVKKEGGQEEMSLSSPGGDQLAEDEHCAGGLSRATLESPTVPQSSPLETFVQGETSSGTRVAQPPSVQSRVVPMPFHVTNPHPHTPKRKQSIDSGIGTSCSTTRTATTTSTNTTYENSVEYGVGFNTSITNGDDVSITFTPRRLFAEDISKTLVGPDSVGSTSGSARAMDVAVKSCIYGTAISQVANEAALAAAGRIANCTTTEAVATTPTNKKDEDLIIRNGVLLRGKIDTPGSSTTSLQPPLGLVSLPSLTDFNDGDEKQMNRKKLLENSPPSRKRHINTLPSTQRGKPIRLRVTEAYGATNHPSLLDQCNASGDEHDSCSAWTSEPDDVYEPNQFSYDPYFSTGQYHITTLSDKPWGNGLSVRMGVQYMTLQDQDGRVLAVTRSRHTWVPSHVIYSPKPRFEGQIPSSHRPVTDGANLGSQQGIVDLYPWALVRKEGRDMEHDVTVHFAEEIRSNTVLTMNKGVGSFSPNPAFRSRHGFEGDGLHSHTVVSRIVSADMQNSNCGYREHSKTKEIPCCLVIRDPIDRDVFNVTIAPGIDPLLILCYLVVHSKMDVEPMLSG